MTQNTLLPCAKFFLKIRKIKFIILSLIQIWIAKLTGVASSTWALVGGVLCLQIVLGALTETITVFRGVAIEGNSARCGL